MSEDVGEPQVQQWVFYLLTHHRPDFRERTKQFELASHAPDDMPSGSLIVLHAQHPKRDELLHSPTYSLVQVINDVAGEPAAVILRRN